MKQIWTDCFGVEKLASGRHSLIDPDLFDNELQKMETEGFSMGTNLMGKTAVQHLSDGEVSNHAPYGKVQNWKKRKQDEKPIIIPPLTPHRHRFVAKYVNQIWQTDLHKIDYVVNKNRAKFYLIAFIDDFS